MNKQHVESRLASADSVLNQGCSSPGKKASAASVVTLWALLLHVRRLLLLWVALIPLHANPSEAHACTNAAVAQVPLPINFQDGLTYEPQIWLAKCQDPCVQSDDSRQEEDTALVVRK